MTSHVKNPTSYADYTFDWEDWLEPGESLVEANWLIHPREIGGLSLDNSVTDGTETALYVSGGISGRQYQLSCQATTSEARIVDRSFIMRIEEA